VVCTGGYFAAGFIGTIGHGDNWDRIDPSNKHPFLVKDEGAARQLAQLYDFFTALPYWRMDPSQQMVRGNCICMAIPGEVYVVYVPSGGRVELDLTKAKPGMKARWYHAKEGKFHDAMPIAVGGWQQFEAPGNEDWALLVQ
jgi:hypothetical protein